MNNFILLGILVFIVQSTVLVLGWKLEDKINEVIKLLKGPQA